MQGITPTLKTTLKDIPNQPLTITLKIPPPPQSKTLKFMKNLTRCLKNLQETLKLVLNKP